MRRLGICFSETHCKSTLGEAVAMLSRASKVFVCGDALLGTWGVARWQQLFWEIDLSFRQHAIKIRAAFDLVHSIRFDWNR